MTCWFIGIKKVQNRRKGNLDDQRGIREAYRADLGIFLHVLYQRASESVEKEIQPL